MAGERKAGGGVSKQRLDALTDGVFAFAMTLLVISLDLPAGVKLADAGELLDLLYELRDNLLVYVISFMVLGARWLRNAKDQGSDLWCSQSYAWAVILHLFFVTLIPFSTKLVGLYGNFWPAVCIYAANTIFGALASWRAAELLAGHEARVRTPEDRLDTAVLIASALLSCVVAVWSPGNAMYAYLLNVVSPLFHRLVRAA